MDRSRDIVRKTLELVRAEFDQPAVVRETIECRGEAGAKNVQQIAAAQPELPAIYHQVALNQSKRCFDWALIGSGAGLVVFNGALGSRSGRASACHPSCGSWRARSSSLSLASCSALWSAIIAVGRFSQLA
jgi:hypothetical protein